MRALYFFLFFLYAVTVVQAQSDKRQKSDESPAKANMVQTFPVSRQEGEPEQAAEATTADQLLPGKQKVAARGAAKGNFGSEKSLPYLNDFSGDTPGAMPSRWFASEEGHLLAIPGSPGLWLRLAKKASYAPASKFALPDAFTLEIDLLLQSPLEEGLGTVSFCLAAIEEENATEAWRYPHTTAHLYVGWNYSAFTIRQAGKEESHYSKHPILRQEVGKPVRIAIAVENSRYTLWVNEEKIMDIPGLIEEGHGYNSLLVQSQLSKVDETHQALISNIKLSRGQASAGQKSTRKKRRQP